MRPTARGEAAAPRTPALLLSRLLRLCRMRHAVRKLLKGDQPVKVGVVGGSVTFLEDDVKAIGWWAKLARYITLAFPKTKVGRRSCRQGGASGRRGVSLHIALLHCLGLPGAAWCYLAGVTWTCLDLPGPAYCCMDGVA